MKKYNPVSTYRLQFNQHFTLTEAEKIIQYLDKTGIKTVYASPVFMAVKGSMHGYDVTNPLQINPEIGTKDDFERFVDQLHARQMGWLQDIVPNHMAFSPENPWLYDVLELGEESNYYRFFDIQHNHPDFKLQGKLMLPFFGNPLNELIQHNELKLVFTEGGFQLNYYENHYPVSKKAYSFALNPMGDLDAPAAIMQFLDELNQFPMQENKQKLCDLANENPDVRYHIERCLSIINSNHSKMKELIAELNYQPCYWKDTESKINYRRFFTINGLICINVQDEEVFQLGHELIRSWLKKKLLNGLRVDHIDGLYHPSQYLERLRKLAGDETYITVEKILEKDEKLPGHWPVEGTTGYDFLAMVNNLLTNPEKGSLFYSYYNNWIKKTDEYRDVFYKKNRFILYNRFRGELDNLTHELQSILKELHIYKEKDEVRKGLGEFLVFCPVYKIYPEPSEFKEKEREQMKAIIASAKQENPDKKNILDVLEDLFLLVFEVSGKQIVRINTFFRHCMQFTGPLMAKGIEDTAFYSYNPFIGHNEVGDSPGYFGIRTETFHQLMQERFAKSPLTMNATSTHDTKRGEDARARLNVLSDLPEEWIEATKEWRKINREYKLFDGEKEIPTANDEYFIYQVLCAHLPMNGKLDDSFVERVQEYLVKALREAKVNSSWSDPDEHYEKNTLKFVRQILSASSNFAPRFLAFMKQVIPHGIVNSLTQLVLKNTCPGVPDTYQGCERWNLSFVDPDNRRPVNYRELADELDEMIRENEESSAGLAKELMREAVDGRIKQWMTYLTLKERKKEEELFLKGSYIPLKAQGQYANHIIAFYRQYHGSYLLVILPLNTAALPSGSHWEDTWLELPELEVLDWENPISKDFFQNTNRLMVRDVFAHIPFGYLKGVKK